MPTQFGYKANAFGYLAAPKTQPVQAVKPLSLAAAGKPTQQNPYGLAGASSQAQSPQFATPILGTGPSQPTSTAQMPSTATTAAAAAAAQPQHPALSGYDLNVDPALQQTNAFTGMGDQQAQAAAAKQRQDLALQYGDQGIARQVGGDTLAQAAAANPHSTLAQYASQRDQNLKALTDFHNVNNTFYGGARILDEQNAGNDYQNALAAAAGNVNSELGGIDTNLASALGANQQARIQATQDAENRALQQALANQSTSGLDPATLAALLGGLGGGAADGGGSSLASDVGLGGPVDTTPESSGGGIASLTPLQTNGGGLFPGAPSIAQAVIRAASTPTNVPLDFSGLGGLSNAYRTNRNKRG